MRKRLIDQSSQDILPSGQNWLNLERLAQVEFTSEDAAHPVESALLLGTGSAWHAARPGEQLIRLLFDEPLSLRRIRLLFCEEEEARTQEFVLRWSTDGGRSYREVVRQQYNFSPPGTTFEVEEYSLELDEVTALELRIVPDINGRGAFASLAQLRLA
jgi:hypothetical protein